MTRTSPAITRKEGEWVRIGEVWIQVVRPKSSNSVRRRIVAPPEVRILRAEFVTDELPPPDGRKPREPVTVGEHAWRDLRDARGSASWPPR